MTSFDRQQERVQDLRRQGVPDVEIGRRLGVSRWTLTRQFGPRRRALRDPGARPRVESESNDHWPVDRHWLAGWTAADARKRTGWNEDFSRRMVAAGSLAERKRNRWAAWFIRLLIEQSESGSQQPNPSDRATLLAGLTILSEWLGEPACLGLRNLILKYEPFRIESEFLRANEEASVNRIPPPTARQIERREIVLQRRNVARKGFGAAARPLVRAIRERAESLSLSGLLNLPQGGQSDPHAALSELLGRLPMADLHDPIDEPLEEVLGNQPAWGIEDLANWQLFLRVFLHEPLEV